MNEAEKKNVFMSVRLTKGLRQMIKDNAERNHRTFSGQMLHYIAVGIEEELNAKTPSLIQILDKE